MINKLFISVAAIVVMSACSGQKNQEVQSNVHAQKLDLERDSSTTLTEAAELVLSPNNYNVSYQLFTVALKKDPSNFKAKFYLALFDRIELMRGLEERAKGISKLLGFESELAKFPQSAQIVSSVLTAKNTSRRYKIDNVSDFQKLMLEYRNSSVKFYKLLKANSQTSLSLTVPLAFQLDGQTEACDVKKGAKTDYKIVCKTSSSNSYMLQAPDLIALRLASIVDALYISIPLAYNWSGWETRLKLNQDISSDEFKAAVANTNFGKLLYPDVLKIYRTIGTDALQALKWWSANATTYCGEPKSKQDNVTEEAVSPAACSYNRKDLAQTISRLEQILDDKIYVEEKRTYFSNLEGNSNLAGVTETALGTGTVRHVNYNANYVVVENASADSTVIHPLSMIETGADNVFALFANQPVRKCSETVLKREYVTLKDVAETVCESGVQ